MKHVLEGAALSAGGCLGWLFVPWGWSRDPVGTSLILMLVALCAVTAWATEPEWGGR